MYDGTSYDVFLDPCVVYEVCDEFSCVVYEVCGEFSCVVYEFSYFLPFSATTVPVFCSVCRHRRQAMVELLLVAVFSVFSVCLKSLLE